MLGSGVCALARLCRYRQVNINIGDHTMTADDLLPDDSNGSSQPSLAGMRTSVGPTRVKPRWRRLRFRSCGECYRGARKIRALRREADCRAAARRVASRQDRDQFPSSRAGVGAVATVAIVRVGVTGQM